MKRTRETIFNGHPDWHEREGVSGCKEFDGEDLRKHSHIMHRVRCTSQTQQGNVEVLDHAINSRET